MLARNAFNKKRFFKSDIWNVREVQNILKTDLCFCFKTSNCMAIQLLLMNCVLKNTAFCNVWNEILILIYIFDYFVELELAKWYYLNCLIFYWSFTGLKWVPRILITLMILKDLKEITSMIYYCQGALYVFKKFYLSHFILIILMVKF